MSANPAVQNVLSVRARLGEGPLWNAERQVLHWVDIYNRRVHTFDPATATDAFIELDTLVSGLFLGDRDHLIVAQENGLGQLNLTTEQVTPLVPIEADRPDNRLNDVRCDGYGRLWIGTMNNDEKPLANLYRYDRDGTLRQVETGLSISNGLGWSPDQSRFYLTDTPRKMIYAYRFEAESGAICDRRPFIDLTHELFYPDGLTVDAEGCLWSAMWNGGCVIRFDPQGREMQRIALPVPLVTACTFGGPHLTDLYITTASAGMSQAELKQYYQAGDLFCLRTDIQGLPSDRCGQLPTSMRVDSSPTR
ncbi:SMP-30/gluconolactonase/LRE family protein [Leptolyngbya iicbica]|uniref:SMP-30/gluconolactonase/LRE family protein n=2 Tax=Cyanophyceae TaxID=3028117 RepID=A0A4Q7EG98_9CYAN|nr:SMP-30/gluconolactonase/LRE family protein [Leptolyngbya sp. LK]RZM82107.1 SMP-30/gluconolactonase/LRE family protein [Leptolyngbya sp. LK]